MLDKTSEAQRFRSFMENTLRPLIEAAAENRATEVYSFAPKLCELVASCGRTIVSAVPVREDDGTTSIGAHFEFNLNSERYPPPRHPRRFDVVFFAAFLWMDAACAPDTGEGFFYQALPKPIDGKQKYYLRFGDGGRGAGARVYATRIVTDAGAGIAARFAEEHHTYRRADLLTQAQRNSRLPRGEHGRERAIQLALELFGRGLAFPPGCEGFPCFTYEAVLRDLLKYADTFHGGDTQAR